jgi:hypothetical protein
MFLEMKLTKAKRVYSVRMIMQAKVILLHERRKVE